MKKALVLLLLLVCVGAFAFADTMAAPQGQFHAWNEGVFIPYTSYNGGTGAAGYAPTWDTNPGIDQEWNFTFDSPTDKQGNAYGFSAWVEWGGDNFFGAGSSNFSVNTTTGAGTYGAWSWFDTYYKFGSIAKFEVGKPRVGDWSVFSPVEGVGTADYNELFQSDFGGYLELYPTSGFNVALALFAPSGSGAENAALGLAANTANNFGIAASYAVPNLVTINAFFKEESPYGTIPTNETAEYFTVDASITAMSTASIIVAYTADLSESNDLLNHIMLGASDTIGNIYVALDVGALNDTAGTSFAVVGQAEYHVTPAYGLGAKIGYDDGNGINWFEAAAVANFAGFVVYPYFATHFDNGSSINIGVLYATGATPSFTDSTGRIVPGANQADATIAIPIDYVWSF